MRRKINVELKRVAGKLLIVILFFSCGLVSCTYYTNEYNPVPENVSFNDDIIPIFNASCNMLGCHNAGGILPDLTPDNAYVYIFGLGYVEEGQTAEESLFYQSVDGGSMNDYTTDEERAYIKKWIDDGAENN